ncbi:hypothetical protein B0H17DRAFT_1006413 [Mycena rosella]|uniref:C3H1-type domain-containing protein n=1 Tax=Mycena rosella TaxID=1033263 RepID=A0AAD7DU16_MYCRO|nr:hypothetical protein B0H17DRAFT_1006413 [Mycena rosella]
MATEAQIKSEIARLTATISQHKSANSTRSTTYQPPRSSTYVNPNYRPPTNKYIRPATSTFKPPSRPAPPTTQVTDVVLNGVAFESSNRSLVRKDLPKPPSTSAAKPIAQRPHFLPAPGARVYKPKPSRGRRGGPVNMTLTNSRRPYQSVAPPKSDLSLMSTPRSRRLATKRLKYSDKPCPRFTTTGSCSRGLTCLYQHDPAKIAICWNFLQGNCSNTAETCNLSHDPTPERTPLCLHFLNKGRCTRERCPFPHVNVGARTGVCRDFAVLGYCAAGLDCAKQHVRECPDFAERGACATKGCKLPHVIRANRNRKPAAAAAPAPAPAPAAAPSVSGVADPPPVSAEDAQLGDEFISLTFNESESSDDEEESDEESEEEGSDGGNDDDARDSPPMETE